MFNVYLPTLLEGGATSTPDVPKTIEASLWDVVIFTLGGCPGAIVRNFCFLVEETKLISTIAWCISYRVTLGEAFISSNEYIHYRIPLHRVCYGGILMGS